MGTPSRARAAAFLSSCALLGAAGALTLGGSPVGARGHRPAPRHTLTKPTWLTGVRITEYYPVPERWFSGRRVPATGLASPHRIDWLYSAHGVSMEGDGIALNGDAVHIDALGHGGWINARGRRTSPGRHGGWSRGAPFWRAGAYWVSRDHLPTFPLEAGGWSSGVGTRYIPLTGVSFAPGPSRPLRYYRSVAVDPRLIPLGSRIYIAAYRSSPGHGWFTAQDTGGAILGRHLDVYRSPPASSSDPGQYLTGQRVYVVPPGYPARLPSGPAPPPSAPPPSPTSPEGGTPPPASTAAPSSAGGASPPS
ncbi:MAG TPA: 3D domain-containing protein [Solirubrobacteraceae bacterium]|jgi:3D (Asp-Asp-Asp) domain-containing protein|nr:3D domain-containing protein [Solirubrobacteraceae bacterium]